MVVIVNAGGSVDIRWGIIAPVGWLIKKHFSINFVIISSGDPVAGIASTGITIRGYTN